MIESIQGIHHISSFAKDAVRLDRFFTQTLGLRRVKQTVNYDAPDGYHLYYGNGQAQPGSAMTFFPFPLIAPGRRGAGEVSTTIFAVPEGSLPFWQQRLEGHNVGGISMGVRFGGKLLFFTGSEGDSFALAEQKDDPRQPWRVADMPAAHAIRGFFGVSMLLQEEASTRELLESMGYHVAHREDDWVRLIRDSGNAAEIIDLEIDPMAVAPKPGSGSVHHIAFAVPGADLGSVRDWLVSKGFAVTPQIDRNYFMSLYFRTPGDVLFEIATNEPGLTSDEPMDHLGETLQLPPQHEHLRPHLERLLPPLENVS